MERLDFMTFSIQIPGRHIARLGSDLTRQRRHD
jgi:hypothetical protein